MYNQAIKILISGVLLTSIATVVKAEPEAGKVLGDQMTKLVL